MGSKHKLAMTHERQWCSRRLWMRPSAEEIDERDERPDKQPVLLQSDPRVPFIHLPVLMYEPVLECEHLWAFCS